MKAGSLGVATACPDPCQQDMSEAGLMSPFLHPRSMLPMIELYYESMRSEMQLSNLAMLSSALSLRVGEVTLSGGGTSLASVTTPEYQPTENELESL